MNIDTNSMARPALAQEADAALNAITDEAKAENTKQIADMSEGVDQAHVAEHVRGMVAMTMGHLSINASTATVCNAEHWQDWALHVADGVEGLVPAE